MLRAQANVLLLNILEQGDNYVYGILKEIKAVTDGEFEVSEATVYTLFKRLEKDGIIESYWGDETQGGRRKYFRLTTRGKANMKLAIDSWRKVDTWTVKIRSGKFRD
ncbi:MAG: PadR family transcriptional regulator [Streptococcaceae bacterium]|jgi:DNA-binding PadR family transcriptional regulator|nr:PadR family transcriptional regulator [Streptococcaceae bacterium]